MAGLGSCLGRSGLDCVHNVLIAGATAEIPLKAVPDLSFSWIRVSFQNLLRHHNHARRTETALQCMFIPECFLDRVQIPITRQALNCENVFPVGLNGKHGTRFHGDAIEGNTARAAYRRFTADMGTREPGDIANVVNQKEPGLNFVGARFPIQGDTNFSFHRAFLVTWKSW
jgi:hypothetical protein